jgi:hypothetical protein
MPLVEPRLLLAAVLALATTACIGPLDPDQVSKLQITTEPWEPLDPRTPKPDPKAFHRVSKVLREGAGPEIGVGDLVQLRVRTRKAAKGQPFADEEGEGWLWMGFQRYGFYEFHVETDGIATALLGRKGGSVVTIARDSFGQYDEGQLGHVSQMPFGRDSDFANPLRKTPSPEKRAQGHRGAILYADGLAGREGSAIEILRVCKGEASQRLTDLVATHPKRLAQDLGRTFESKDPRHHYVREAKWEGRCDDGKTARYAFGPIEVETPRGRPDKEWHFDKAPYEWVEARWGEVPIGVVLQ